MPVYYCAGTNGCQRLISVTSAVDGNMAAFADPEAYASNWTLCARCHAFTCDRCLSAQQGHCKCGAEVRLYSDTERLSLALGSAPIPATSAPSQPVAPSLRQVLEGIVKETEVEVAGQRSDRAHALAALAATVMVSQGATASIDDLLWYTHIGEQFYRWRFFAEGAQYWKGLHQLATAAGVGQSDDGRRIMAAVVAFQVLAGEVTAASPHAAANSAFVAGIFGPAHVLTQEVQARLGSAGPAAQPAAEPYVIMSPSAPTAAPATAAYDAITKNALWVTLAFMDMATADGKVHEQEVEAWKRTMLKLRLPNVWEQFGTERLQLMLQQGLLARLSAELGVIPLEKRAELAEILLEFMAADGRIDPAETDALERITGWLGVSVHRPGS